MKFEYSPCFEDAVKILQEIVSRPGKKTARKIDKPLAVYGAGKLGKMAVELLERIGMPPDLVIDKNPEGHRNDPFWRDRAIVAASDVPHEVRKSFMLAISIATLPYEELAASLADQGWIDIVPFYDVSEAYRDIYPLSNGWVLDQFDSVDVTATRKVLENWGDDISRAHHLQFIAWHRLHEDWIFADAPIDTGNRYFIPEVMVTLGGHESFLDVGAHHGEVSKRFLEELYHECTRVWMIEPDPCNYAKIQEWLLSLNHKAKDHFKLLCCAVAGSSGQSKFYGGIGYASQLSGLGHKIVEVTTIDQLNLTPTFIKLHLEGGELDALEGAIETIRNYQPLLAITVYHSAIGVWQIPTWLITQTRRMGLDYRFLLRLHSWCGTGAVLYCIPKGKFHHVATGPLGKRGL